jgi:FkbM family methyltransferase
MIAREALDARTVFGGGLLRGMYGLGRMRYRTDAARTVGWAAWGAWLSLRAMTTPFARRRPLTSVATLWAWEIWRRSVHRPVVVTLPEGSRIVCPPWSRLASSLISEGFPEPATALFVLDLVRPGDRFIDVGANVGLYSILAARRGARVMAFEPIERCRDAMVRGAELNGVLGAIAECPCALAETSGRAFLTTNRDISDTLVDATDDLTLAERMSAVVVEVRTLDRTVARFRPAIVKIDAGAAGRRVLEGAERTILASRPAIVIDVWHGGAEARAWLEQRGYGIYGYASARRELEPVPPGDDRHTTWIAVHRDEVRATRERLRLAEPLALHEPRVDWLGA